MSNTKDKNDDKWETTRKLMLPNYKVTIVQLIAENKCLTKIKSQGHQMNLPSPKAKTMLITAHIL